MCHGFMTHPLFLLHGFFSSDFTDEPEAILLIGLLTDFRGYLAAGQWLAPDMCCCCFLVTQISQMTQIFLRGIIFVPQISQIYTDFSSWDYFCHADFADDADFSSWDYFVPQISQIYTDFSPWDYFCPTDFADDADFSSWDFFCPTDFTDLHRFF